MTAQTAPYSPLRLLTEKEAAQLTGFSVRTLQNWRIRGGGPPFVRISARAIRYRWSDIETWIESRLRMSTTDSGESSDTTRSYAGRLRRYRAFLQCLFSVPEQWDLATNARRDSSTGPAILAS